MKLTNKLFYSSIIIIFSAWIAKMQFIFGGDYLFRIGSIGVLISLTIQIFEINNHFELKSNKLTRLFILNSISLFIVYLGMMMKVSHIMNSQFEKDFVLDFIGIPAILTSILYTFINIDRLLETSKVCKIFFYKKILLPWVLFLFSFLLYNTYSTILTRI
jgi:hypothetical protein